MSAPCPSCGEPTFAGASFCEACGTELVDRAGTSIVEASESPAAPSGGSACVDCGAAPTQIADGYCMVCGHKQPGPRDRVEIDLGHAAGVSDRGRRHQHNEDAMALAAVEQTFIAVVCDGVSTTDNPELASQAAADAALAVLSRAAESETDPEDAMAEAVEAAQAAVVEVPHESVNDGSPSTTIVAAMVAVDADTGAVTVTVGWLGDSRAYWLGSADLLLTADHSWAAEMVAGGLLSAEEATTDPRASTITRWLGRDTSEIAPSVVRVAVDAPGTLVVCSDGLWNYASAPAELRAVPALGEPTALERARSLVAFANDAGGHDNITVVLASLDPGTGTQGDLVAEAPPGGS